MSKTKRIRFMKKEDALQYILESLRVECEHLSMDDEEDRKVMTAWIYEKFRL